MPLSADHRPPPLANAVALEAVLRLQDAQGPLDDAQALRQAFDSQPTRSGQLLAYGWLLGQRMGLPAVLAHWRRLAWLAVCLLAALMALGGFGLARSALGEGRSINAVAAFVALLAPHALALLLWLAQWAWPRGRGGGALLGGLALWLAAHLPPRQGPQALAVLPAATAVLRRHGLLPWLTGAIGHGVWTLAFVITLAALAFGFAFKAYTLNWESTILSPGFFRQFVQASGWLPAALGFAVPDAAAVHAAGPGGSGAPGGQQVWAWWLMGCVAVYGLLPRLLLLLLCLWRWRQGVHGLRGQADMSDAAVRRLAGRLEALEPPPRVIDAERPAPRSGAEGRPAPAHAQPAVLGFELPPEQTWPLPGLPAPENRVWRIDGSAAERASALARLRQEGAAALLVVVHAPSSPDRGTARFLHQAAALAQYTALLALPAAAEAAAEEQEASGHTAAAARWRDWLQAGDAPAAITFCAHAAQAAHWLASPHD